MKQRTIERDLANAERRLADLTEELAGLPAATLEARRSGDAARWMSLTNRADDLPAEIYAARREVLPHRLAAAWREVEARTANETAARADAESARTAFVAAGQEPLEPHSELSSMPLRQAAAIRVESAARQPEIIRLSMAAEAAAHVLATAVDATCEALFVVDEIEAEYGPVLKDSRERVLCCNVTVSTMEFGPLVDASTLPSCLVAGQRMPRWLAHRCGPHLFVEPDNSWIDSDRFTTADDEATSPEIRILRQAAELAKAAS